MNTVILYDRIDAVQTVTAVLNRARSRTREGQPWSITAFHADLPLAEATARTAMEQMKDAHLLVIALHSEPLPSWMLDWLKQWAETRVVDHPALAVWFEEACENAASRSVQKLRDFAEKHGLKFVFPCDAPKTGDHRRDFYHFATPRR